MQIRTLALLIITVVCCVFPLTSHAQLLEARLSESKNRIEVFPQGKSNPILVQNAKPDFRPFIHPIVAPDGRGVLTEFSPQHHKHQTGLYWGFTRVNGRDYFHHPEGDYWKRVSAEILKEKSFDPGDTVRWKTVYDLLDAKGTPVLRETQQWTLALKDNRYFLDLEWSGKALVDVTIGQYDYGGLFLRMPWTPKTHGHAFNAARQKDARAEGQRAVWTDVGMEIEGREDEAHITMFDHPANPNFPNAWRVDGQLGIGPAASRLGDIRIPKGKQLNYRHRLLIHTGELNDAAVTELWSRYSGQSMAWAQWGLAQKEGREAKFLEPDEAVNAMTVTPGFKVNVFAAEPTITQPMAFCWDDAGRLWIAENRDYESRGSGFSNSGDSRILILEDTDHDGVVDSRKVFAEGIPFPAGLAVGMGGVWVGAPPNLLFIPDADGDDRADMDKIEVRLTGWGIRDRHETLNSFHWGPDGWLYGCQGFATPSRVGKPKGKGRLYKHKDPFPTKMEFDGKPVDINGGVWRYHPVKDRFEVVAHGFSNPWGIDYDSKGQLFITACVIPHLWHVIPGGIYHRQGGSHFNPYVYSDIRTIANHRHRSAHGGARVYQSDAFPEKYRGRIFMANIHEHAVLTDVLQPKGSGFVGVHGDDFVLANNAQWIGFSVEIGPDGAVYVLDWHDADICGKDILNKDTGRVFRIAPEKSNARNFPGRFDNLAKLDDIELARLQLSPSDWHARRARVILQHRATKRKISPDAAKVLTRIVETEPNGDLRLRAYWTMYVSGLLDESALQAMLADRDPYLRAWSIQFLCEEKPSRSTTERLVKLAGSDPSPVVRLYLASAMQRVDDATAWGIAEGLVQHVEDASDHNIPRMVWFGVEPLVIRSPEKALALAADCRLPLVSRHIARRLSDGQMYEILVDGIREAKTGRQDLLLGMRDGLEGRYNVKAPANWSPVYQQLRQDSRVARIVEQLNRQFGDVVAAEEMLRTLDDAKAPVEDRREALVGLAGRKRPELGGRLLKLLDDRNLRIDAIRAVSNYDDVRLAREILNRYRSLTDEEKLEAVHTLAMRSRHGWELTLAIKKGTVPRSDVPAYVARQLQRVVGNGFLEVWGPIEAISADKARLFDRYRALLTPDRIAKANTGNGKKIFEKTCASCHKLYGAGGEIGPDLTGSNRTNLEYILGNVITPSAIIQDDYRMHLVQTFDGRNYSGIPANEDERFLRLRVANRQEPVLIPKSDIEAREIAKVSMMPEGLLKELTDDQVLDLIAFLQQLKPAPRKAE